VNRHTALKALENSDYYDLEMDPPILDGHFSIPELEAILYLLRHGGPKYKLRTAWTCSNGAHHEHRTKFGAWLCGRRQAISTGWFNLTHHSVKLTGSKITYPDPPDSITEIDKLKAYLESGDEIEEAGCNSAGYYLKCSNGKLVMACLGLIYPVHPVSVPTTAVRYQAEITVGRWK